MARGGMGGKISRGPCEGLQADIGNTLDPYCWDCARKLERAIEARVRSASPTWSGAGRPRSGRAHPAQETISAALDRFNRKEALEIRTAQPLGKHAPARPGHA